MEFYAGAGSFASWQAAFRLVGDTANGGLAAFTLPGGSGSNVVATNIAGAMQNVNASCYVRAPFAAGGPGALTSLSLKMRYNDGYTAYLNNGTVIAQRNAPASPVFNSAATAVRSDANSLMVDPVNVTAFLPQLLHGGNVLAIQGLNTTAADGTFLVLPELLGGTLNAGAQAVFFDSTRATPGSINGTEVARTAGLPADPAFDFYASGVSNENAEADFAVPPSVLVSGANTVAVEVHQRAPDSSDVSFNFSLAASRTSIPAPYFVTGSGVKNLRVCAYDSGTATWSALVDSTYLVNTDPASSANLAISEIMYHPADPSAAEVAAGFTNSDDFEFLEFVNIGPRARELDGQRRLHQRHRQRRRHRDRPLARAQSADRQRPEIFLRLKTQIIP